MKKFFVFLTLLLCISGISLASSRNIKVIMNRGVKISYNNKIQQFSNVNGTRVFPLSYEGTTYLPVRAISSLFNTRIRWDGNTNSVYIGDGTLDTTSAQEARYFIAENNQDIDVLLNEDIKIYFNGLVQTFRDVNGKVVYPLSYEGTTYLPVRAISNLFKSNIEWDGTNKTVLISTNSGIKVEGVTLDKNSIELTVGESYKLNEKITPENATNKSVEWTSSNTSIVSITNGNIVALNEGIATVAVRTIDGNKVATCVVRVKPKSGSETGVLTPPSPSPSGSSNESGVIVLLNKITTTVGVGQSETLIATVKPDSLSNSIVTWESSAPEIASVVNGTVTGNKAGTATITAKVQNGVSMSCLVKVDAAIVVEKISLNQSTLNLRKGATFNLSVSFQPSNSTNKSLKYTSSNTSVATVDQNGKITAIGDGTATITVKTDNNKEATCQVKVSQFLQIGDGADINSDVDSQTAENGRLLWKFFVYYGFTEEASAAILGNMERESHILPWNNAGDRDKDRKYVASVDNGEKTKKQFIKTSHHNGSGNEGFGLLQWTSDTKKTKLYEYMKEQNNYKIYSLQGQAEFVIDSFGWESTSLEHLKKSSSHSWQASYLKGYSSLVELFKNCHDVKDCVDAIGCIYCRSGAINKGGSSRENALSKRREKAQAWYKLLKGTYTP